MTEAAGTTAVIDVRGISVDYGEGRLALDALSMRIGPGCHGLLGVNGAGKSTLIRVLLGLLRPHQGEGHVLGQDLRHGSESLRLRVGYMPESDAHLGDLPALETVAMLGELSGLGRIEATRRAHEVLHYCGLGEARMRSAGGFSAGMRQRLKLACALVHDPDLLFLDEPANGLDPSGRELMLDMLREVARNGVSILVSTHLLPDVAELCDSVVIVSQGRVVRSGRVQDLIADLNGTWRVRVEGDASVFTAGLVAAGLSADWDAARGDLVVRGPADRGTLDLFRVARDTGVGISALTRGSKSIEDVFFESIEVPHGHS